MLELKGLPAASHLGAALAAFSLYEIFPGCKIRFNKLNHNYYPVIDNLSNIDEIVEKLCNLNTWKDIFKLSHNLEVDIKYKLSQFEKIACIDPYLALAFGSNHKLKEEAIVPNTPFFKLMRNAIPLKERTEVKETKDRKSMTKEEKKDATRDNAIGEINKLISHVITTPLKVKKHLSCDKWELEPGQHFGFFRSNYRADPVNQCSSTILKVKKEKASKEPALSSEERTVPIIVLLALTSLKLLPTFICRGKSTSLGWDNEKNRSFHYPMFTEFWTKDRFLNTISNPKLTLKADRPKDELRNAWRLLGVNAIYRSFQNSIVQNKYTTFYFSTPTLV